MYIMACKTNGRCVSHYRLLSLVGIGGMGEVYQARDLRLSRRVAIKFINAEMAREPMAGRRFLKEARLAASLTHPNIYSSTISTTMNTAGPSWSWSGWKEKF